MLAWVLRVFFFTLPADAWYLILHGTAGVYVDGISREAAAAAAAAAAASSAGTDGPGGMSLLMITYAHRHRDVYMHLSGSAEAASSRHAQVSFSPTSAGQKLQTREQGRR